MIRELAIAFDTDATGKTAHARFHNNPDHIKVRFCGLHRRPRLRQYAALLDWSGLAAPTRSVTDATAFAGRLDDGGDNEEAESAETILARLDALTNTDGSFNQGSTEEVALDALSLAARQGHTEIVSALLASNVSPDGRVSRSNKATSPLMLAAMHGHGSVAQVLVAGGASLNLTNSASRTAAHMAARASADVLQLLLTAGTPPTVRDLNRWTCLHHAAWVGHVEGIRTLLGDTTPSNKRAPTGEDSTRLQQGVEAVDIDSNLNGTGADTSALLPNAQNADKCSKVHKAVSKKLAREHRNRNKVVDPNAKDRWSRTPLAWAVFNNHVGAVDYLLAHGAKLHPKFEKGRSRPQASHQRRTGNVWTGCMHMAVRNAYDHDDDCAMLRLLLRHRCPVDERDGMRSTALYVTASLAAPPHLARIFPEALERPGASEGPGGVGAGLPTTAAVARAQRESRATLAARLLLQANASVSAVNDAGDTALQVAVNAGNVAVAELLLSAGADPDIVTNTPTHPSSDEVLPSHHTDCMGVDEDMAALRREERHASTATGQPHPTQAAGTTTPTHASQHAPTMHGGDASDDAGRSVYTQLLPALRAMARHACLQARSMHAATTPQQTKC
eukprot:m.1421456 g.1421456  ORF g.1421456 m.1421456 type:complete len:617 (-) comp25047_c0_seq29:2393-4243(-)